MTTDEKIEEVLNIVRETREMTLETREMAVDTRAIVLETRAALSETREVLFETRGMAQETREMALETRALLIEERVLNNARFNQLASGLIDVRKELKEMKTELNAKIDQVNNTLSQDIQAFGEELYDVKRRVNRLEKKQLS